MDKYKIIISKELESERTAIRKVEPIFYEIKERLGIQEDVFYNMLIAVTEAINNAVYHGNKYDKEKVVKVEVKVFERNICVEIRDEGSGFEPKKIDDPRKPENLTKTSGRGVFLISKLSDSYEYKFSKDGTLIKMFFSV